MSPSSIRHVSCPAEPDEDDVRCRISAFAINEIAPLIPPSTRLIAIDGFDGVGKSTLGQSLANFLELPLVSLDRFLESARGFYFEALRFSDISQAIELALSNADKVIVEGCQVAAVLERIDKVATFKIYVMRTQRMRPGPEGERIIEYDVLYGCKSTDQLVAELQEDAQRWAALPIELTGGGTGQISSLEHELILYHRRERPHDKADIIVKVERST